MKKLFTKLSVFKMIMLEGISFWTKAPLKLKLRLDDVKKTPYPITRLVRVDLPDNNVDFVEKTIMTAENTTVINFSLWENYYKNHYPYQITINKEKEEFKQYENLQPDYSGSGYIGTVLFSLPIVVLCLPYIFAVRWYYKTMEKKFGFSRYDRAILNALKGQLDSDTEQLLIRIMKKNWQHKQYLNKKLTFAEAKEFLSTQHLVETTTIGTDVNNLKVAEVRTRWFDEKNNLVAEVFDQNIYELLTIFVLGSQFTKKKAKALLDCYKTKEERVIDTDKIGQMHSK